MGIAERVGYMGDHAPDSTTAADPADGRSWNTINAG